MPFKVVILNDTSISGHFGGKLVMNALYRELGLRDVEVLQRVQVREPWEGYKKIMDKADLIIVNGEGSIHHGSRMELLEVAEYYPSALINAVYQEVPSNKWVKDFKYIAVRESLSQEKVAEHGGIATVVPDLLFTHNIPRPEITEDLCLVDSCVSRGTGLKPTEANFIRKMGSAAKVCTGRFHGACLAMLWGMPFSAYPSNTHKTKGMLMDAGCNLYFDTQEEALDNIGEFDATTYISNARKAISDMFNQVVECGKAPTGAIS